MKCTIEINCDNAAFEDNDLGSEISRILQTLAQKLALQHLSDLLNRQSSIRLNDSNGNHVGMFRLILEPGDSKSASDMEVLD